MVLTKAQLVNMVNNAFPLILTCYPARELLFRPTGLQFLNSFTVNLGKNSVLCDTLANSIQGSATKKGILYNGFETTFMIRLTVEVLESIRDYCKDTNQINLLQNEPWYDFMRIVRNALVHSLTWVFNKYDLDILPVTYNGKAIALQMAGKDIDLSFYNMNDLWLWLEEVEKFLQKIK